MEASVSDIPSLQRYMGQLRVNDDLRPTQVENVKNVFEMINDLKAKKGNWQNWNWKEDFGSVLGIEELGRARESLFTPDDFGYDRMNEAQKAAAKGLENIVAFAIYVAQNHHILNCQDVYGRTLLHMVAGSCSVELCRMLTVKGGDETHTDTWGDTPLHLAARYGRIDHLKAMLSKLTRAEIGSMYYRIPFRAIPNNGVEIRNNDGKTAIHIAAEVVPAERIAVAILVKYGKADIDATVSFWCFILMVLWCFFLLVDV